jgi:hypothetical protein
MISVKITIPRQRVKTGSKTGQNRVSAGQKIENEQIASDILEKISGSEPGQNRVKTGSKPGQNRVTAGHFQFASVCPWEHELLP